MVTGIDLIVDSADPARLVIKWVNPRGDRLVFGWSVLLFILSINWYFLIGCSLNDDPKGFAFICRVFMVPFAIPTVLMLIFGFRGTFASRMESVEIDSKSLIYRVPAVMTYQFLGEKEKARNGIAQRMEDCVGSLDRAVASLFAPGKNYQIGIGQASRLRLRKSGTDWFLTSPNGVLSDGPLLESHQAEIVVDAIRRWIGGFSIQQNQKETAAAIRAGIKSA